jgi:non-ribosomal peptide synthetase-like protein
MIGGVRIHNGIAEIKQTTIGRRTFIGNSAFIRGGVTLGDETLLGVMSTPPINSDVVPSNTQWLGVPGFALPRPKVLVFDDGRTFNPTKNLQRTRAIIDAARILLPGYLSACSLFVMIAIAAFSFSMAHWWVVGLALPLIVNFVAVLTMVVVAVIKRVIIGTFTPSVHPLWSPFVWLNDVINGVFETITANAMAPFMGTPYAAPLLRLMGCKIGKWCYIETTFFSEFDLVRVGDYAALNLGSTLQTHLFEDRVMKSDVLTVGEGCSVGNMAIVLYSTVMERGSSLGPLSVLIKGETLPEMSRWGGIPSLPRTQFRSTSWSLGKKSLSEPRDASVAMAAAQ